MHTHYTPVAKSLHWLMALMVFGLLALGFYMSDLPLSPEKLQLYSWHKWAGVTVFVLVWVRLAWRITHQPPPMSAGMYGAVKLAAIAGHWMLYVFMVVIPDRKSTRLNSSHITSSYAVFCLKKKSMLNQTRKLADRRLVDTIQFISRYPQIRTHDTDRTVLLHLRR